MLFHHIGKPGTVFRSVRLYVAPNGARMVEGDAIRAGYRTAAKVEEITIVPDVRTVRRIAFH